MSLLRGLGGFWVVFEYALGSTMNGSHSVKNVSERHIDKTEHIENGTATITRHEKTTK
jgi:hypothetical protein